MSRRRNNYLKKVYISSCPSCGTTIKVWGAHKCLRCPNPECRTHLKVLPVKGNVHSSDPIMVMPRRVKMQ